DRFVRERGMAPEGFRSAAYPIADFANDEPLAAKYFFERKPLSYASRMFERYRPTRAWCVRYFKPLDREEMQIWVDPESGKVLEFKYDMPEERPGAKLAAGEALTLVTQFAAGRGWDMSRMALKESSSEDKKARRDYKFEWEALPGDERNLDQAHYRLRVELVGDQV